MLIFKSLKCLLFFKKLELLVKIFIQTFKRFINFKIRINSVNFNKKFKVQ
jgi:hypothetical protein